VYTGSRKMDACIYNNNQVMTSSNCMTGCCRRHLPLLLFAARPVRRPCYSTRSRPCTTAAAVVPSRPRTVAREPVGGDVYREDRSIRRCCRINRRRTESTQCGPGVVITFVRQRPIEHNIITLPTPRSLRESRHRFSHLAVLVGRFDGVTAAFCSIKNTPSLCICQLSGIHE